MRQEGRQVEALRDDEVELLGAGEVADARVCDVGRLLSRHHVVPHAHLRRRRRPSCSPNGREEGEGGKVGSERKRRERDDGPKGFLPLDARNRRGTCERHLSIRVRIGRPSVQDWNLTVLLIGVRFKDAIFMLVVWPACGAMAAPASLASLGSARSVSPGAFEVFPSAVAVGRVHVVSSIRFGGFDGWKKWRRVRGRVCKCMVTTNLIEEREIPFSAESTLKVSNSSGGRNDDADLILKPPSKPVLKPLPNGQVDPAYSGSSIWSSDMVVREKPMAAVEGTEKVIQSLGEVLEKVEKLETTNAIKFGVKDIKGNGAPSGGSKPIGPEHATSATKKSKTLKSVWRRGNPVASVQRVVKETPKVKKDIPITTESKISGAAQVAPLRPQMPSPARPKLQARPAAVPPSTPAVKKPDVQKERKPILIDKFASKKPVVDPIAAEAMLAT
ncbi:hypothetical protein GW17_00031549, partial [Ensete ventricosum]